MSPGFCCVNLLTGVVSFSCVNQHTGPTHDLTIFISSHFFPSHRFFDPPFDGSSVGPSGFEQFFSFFLQIATGRAPGSSKSSFQSLPCCRFQQTLSLSVLLSPPRPNLGQHRHRPPRPPCTKVVANLGSICRFPNSSPSSHPGMDFAPFSDSLERAAVNVRRYFLKVSLVAPFTSNGPPCLGQLALLPPFLFLP